MRTPTSSTTRAVASVPGPQAFLITENGLDIVVAKGDSLDAKVLVRDATWARRLPALMATGASGGDAQPPLTASGM